MSGFLYIPGIAPADLTNDATINAALPTAKFWKAGTTTLCGIVAPGMMFLLSSGTALAEFKEFSFLSALPPEATFTRASGGTYFDSAGVMQTAGVDAPRFNHDPVTLAPKGLLIEEARTNLLLRSGDFGNAAWNKQATTVSTGTGAGGSDRVTVDGTTATHGMSQSVSTDTSKAHNFSKVFTYVNNPWVRLAIADGANQCNAWFNIQTGAAGSVTNTGVATGATAMIRPDAGGGYRCTVSGVPNTVNSGTLSELSGIAQSDGDVAAYLGDSTKAVDVAGAQLEVGAFPTSYIATTSSPVTRAADQCSMVGAAFASWFRADEGTFMVEASWFKTAGEGVLGYISKAGAAPRHQLIAGGPGIPGYAVVNDADAVVVGSIGDGAVAPNTITKAICSFGLNDFRFVRDGGAVKSDLTGDPPLTVNALFLGSNGAGQFLNGHIRSFRFWPRKLSNAEMQGATA